MKQLILLSLLSTTFLLSQTSLPTKITDDNFSSYLTKAVDSVESARVDAVKALNDMVARVDEARKEGNVTESISSKIVETNAIANIARNTADVEITKAKAMAEISKAVDSMNNATEETRKSVEETSLKVIVEAVAQVEIAKANASKNIVEATKRVELSKLMPKNIPNAEEILSIAKNFSAVQIAKSVSDVEIAKSSAYIEIAKSSMSGLVPELSPENEKKLSEMKATATAKISSYLAQLEVLKAEIEAKIAQEVAKIEIAETSLKTEPTK